VNIEHNKLVRSAWIDNLRGVLILALLFLHITTNPNIDLISSEKSVEVSELINKLLTPFRMPIFFIISGALSSGLIHRNWNKTLRKSTRRFSYLATIWGIAATLTVSVLKTDLNTEHVLETFSEAIWYLVALSIYIPLTKALSHLNAYIPVSIGVLSYFIAAPPLSMHFSIFSSISFYFFYFAVGVLLSKKIRNHSSEVPSIWMIVSLLFFLLSAFLMQLAPVGYLDALARFLANAFASFFGISISAKWLTKPIPALTKIGRNTISIYLVHYTVLLVLSTSLITLMGGIGASRLGEFLSVLTVFSIMFTVIFVTFLLKAVENHFNLYLLRDPWPPKDE
jgi:surface polysaccharide O-acyltransferase-like enzyme